MDANDLFRKLTTNLSFGRETSLKRKANSHDQKNGVHDIEAVKQITPEPAAASPPKKKRVAKKKKNLLQINREKVEMIRSVRLCQAAKMGSIKVNHIRNIMHINVRGEDVPDPVESLTQLYADCENDTTFRAAYDLSRCPKQLLANLKAYTFQDLTPVQMQVMPIMLNVSISSTRLLSNVRVSPSKL